MNKLVSWLIFLTLAALPAYLIRCKSFEWCVSPVPFTLLEVLILTTFFAWLFVKLRQTGSFEKLIADLKVLIPKKYQIVTGSLIFFSGISVLVSPDKIGALGIYKAYFIEPVLIFIVVLDYLRATKNVWGVVLPLLTSGVIVAAFAIFEKLTSFNPGNPLEFLERGRVSAFYTTSNAVGLFLGPLVFLTAGYMVNFWSDKKRNPKNFLLLASYFLLLLAGLWVSGSRGAWLGVLAAASFLGCLLIIKKLKSDLFPLFSKILLILLGLAVVLNIILLANIGEFFRFNFQEKTIHQRLCLWEGAVKLIEDRPIFGAGLNGYHLLDNEYRTCSSEDLQYPHNLVLNFWIETGLFGLLSFVSLVLWLFFDLIRPPKANFLTFGLAASLVAILVHGLVDVPYFKNDLSMEFWVIVALGVFLTSLNRDSNSEVS